MFWFFIKGTFRNIAANKAITIINILGLALGITCALIISLFIFHETSYDSFHSAPNEIYRITLHGRVNNITIDAATSTGAMATKLKSDFSEVKEATRLARFGAWLISNDSIRYNEDNLLFADSNFFRFFDGFKLLSGNPDSVLSKPYSLVLSESAALKYFGATNIVGKKLLVEADKYFTVTGVMADPPANSHIQFDMLGSIISYKSMLNFWISNNCYTYIRLNSDTDITAFTNSIQNLVKRFVFPEFNKALNNAFTSHDYYRYGVQKMQSIHLQSKLESELHANAKAEYVYAFGITAILILIIACLNFMNLSSANLISRSKEVALRQLVGANKPSLIFQFLTESVFYSLVALAIALLLTEMALPAFNYFFGLKLQFHFFSNAWALILFVLLTLLVGFLSGVYPAIYYISSFETDKVLQSRLGNGQKKSLFRSFFVMFQFFISILLIILTIVVYKQVSFMLKKDLGFDTENVVVIRRSDALKNNIEQFRSEVLQNKSVLSVSYANSIPGREYHSTTFNLSDTLQKSAFLLNQIFVSADYFKTLDIDLVQGRYFDATQATDSFACLINESAARLIGKENPTGLVLLQPSLFKKIVRQYSVIGVVEDFHFQSVDKTVEPLILCFMPGNWEGYLTVKLEEGSTFAGISQIEKVWKKYAQQYPFVYFNLKDDFQKNYDSTLRTGRIFLVFSILSVFLAALGLLGLIAYSLNQRVQEIGVRKALGASNSRLIFEMSSETLWIVGIASVIAWFTAWYISNKWLETFPSNITPQLWMYLLPTVILFVLVLSIVSYRVSRITKQEAGDILR